MPSTTNTPEIIAQECIAVRVRILSRVITKIYDDALRPLGLKTSQMNILVVTGRLGITRPAEICARLKMDLSTLSRNIDRLRTNGWLEITTDDTDARARQIRLSREGAALLEKAKPLWERAQKKAGKLLGGQNGVRNLLDAARSAGRFG